MNKRDTKERERCAGTGQPPPTFKLSMEKIRSSANYILLSVYLLFINTGRWSTPETLVTSVSSAG